MASSLTALRERKATTEMEIMNTTAANRTVQRLILADRELLSLCPILMAEVP